MLRLPLQQQQRGSYAELLFGGASTPTSPKVANSFMPQGQREMLMQAVSLRELCTEKSGVDFLSPDAHRPESITEMISKVRPRFSQQKPIVAAPDSAQAGQNPKGQHGKPVKPAAGSPVKSRFAPAADAAADAEHAEDDDAGPGLPTDEDADVPPQVMESLIHQLRESEALIGPGAGSLKRIKHDIPPLAGFTGAPETLAAVQVDVEVITVLGNSLKPKGGDAVARGGQPPLDKGAAVQVKDMERKPASGRRVSLKCIPTPQQCSCRTSSASPPARSPWTQGAAVLLKDMERKPARTESLDCKLDSLERKYQKLPAQKARAGSRFADEVQGKRAGSKMPQVQQLFKNDSPKEASLGHLVAPGSSKPSSSELSAAADLHEDSISSFAFGRPQAERDVRQAAKVAQMQRIQANFDSLERKLRPLSAGERPPRSNKGPADAGRLGDSRSAGPSRTASPGPGQSPDKGRPDAAGKAAKPQNAAAARVTSLPRVGGFNPRMATTVRKGQMGGGRPVDPDQAQDQATYRPIEDSHPAQPKATISAGGAGFAPPSPGHHADAAQPAPENRSEAADAATPPRNISPSPIAKKSAFQALKARVNARFPGAQPPAKVDNTTPASADPKVAAKPDRKPAASRSASPSPNPILADPKGPGAKPGRGLPGLAPTNPKAQAKAGLQAAAAPKEKAFPAVPVVCM
ncbi:hypothetical protein WJX72_007156 [[Myrmecia] bisecta]|uniref:Uncharacterized protein n=1 Tax=[Myrmecia] bisecta TaxID=41462 RepID=A0AAW1R7N2_9CHLO